MRFERVLCLLLAGCALIAVPACAAITAGGVVYEDLNRNELRDAGEPGIPDVRVSNGREITTTDEAGRYRLPVDDDTILFVIKPRGWRTPLDHHNLPVFYYVHRPDGSPDLHYHGVAPTGPLPDSVDFPLYPQDEPDAFHAILFGDTQPRNQQEIDYLAHDVVEELIGTDASFGVTLGDTMFDDLSLFESLNATVALVGIPWHNVVGNHDINFDAHDDHHSNATFERVYGPPYYSFDYGPVHFLVLDDVKWQGEVEDPEAYWGGNYIGGLSGDQLEFIRRDLEMVPEDQLIVLFMHIPLVADWVEEERGQLYRMIENRAFALSISAHYHTHEHVFITDEDGWRGPAPHHHVINVTTCGSWWSGAPDEEGIPHTTMRDGAPNGYTIIRFDGSDYVIDFKAARRPAGEQMHIWTPEPVRPGQAEPSEVLANVYNGSERSVVEFRIVAMTDWMPMEMVQRPDPYYAAMKELEPDEGPTDWRALPRATDSPHLWRALLPEGLVAGQYVLEVRETDMWGREHMGRRSLRVE